MGASDINPRTLTNDEVLRYAEAALLEASMRKDPWTPLQRELIERLKLLLYVRR